MWTDRESHLSQILDGVDIVMGRGTDQTHTGHGVSHAGDLSGHLVSGQFPAFPRFRTLSHLYLQHIRVRQVGAIHTEASRGDLKRSEKRLPVQCSRKTAKVAHIATASFECWISSYMTAKRADVPETYI